MTKTEILHELTEICREVLDDETLVLTPDMSADDVENWDSMNHIVIMVSVEQKFGVKFRTGEIEELKSIGDFVDLIEEKIQKK